MLDWVDVGRLRTTRTVEEDVLNFVEEFPQVCIEGIANNVGVGITTI